MAVRPRLQGWPEDAGGETVYTAEQEALLTVPPAGNALLVVLRTDDVMRFVRLANFRAGERERWDVSLVLRVAAVVPDVV